MASKRGGPAFHKRLLRRIETWLAHEDETGEPVAAGVAALDFVPATVDVFLRMYPEWLTVGVARRLTAKSHAQINRNPPKAAALALLAARIAEAAITPPEPQSALGQQHPNIERGLLPDKSYQVSDVDTVNLFNGVVNLAIPLGGTYHVNGDLSYQFILSYASNSWETAEHQVEVLIEIEPGVFKPVVVTRRWSHPARGMNAGFGWTLSLGELLLQGPGQLRTTYRSPDGAHHVFYDTLHRNNPSEVLYQGPAGTNPEWVRYTRDNTYLRLRKLGNPDPGSGPYELDFPNGHVHTFDAQGNLTSMMDRYGNHVTIARWTRTGSHAGSPHWAVSDSTGRTHNIYFRPGASYEENIDPGVKRTHFIVDYVDLAAFGGKRARYDFRYANDPVTGPPQSTLTRRHVRNPEPSVGDVSAVSLLEAIDLPFVTEELRYELTYRDGQQASGNIDILRLPSGTDVQYDYITYEFPTDLWPNVGGIFSRKVTAPDASVLSWTEYTPEHYIDGALSEPFVKSAIRPSRLDGDLEGRPSRTGVSKVDESLRAIICAWRARRCSHQPRRG